MSRCNQITNTPFDQWLHKVMLAGYSRNQIKSALKQQGYSNEHANHILKDYQSGHSHSTGHLVSILVLLIFVITLGGAVVYFIHESNAATPQDPKEAQLQALQEPPKQQKPIMDFIREDILPSVVMVECLDPYGEPYAIGSGFYFMWNNTPYVGTNAHVVLSYDGLFHGCNIYFPWENGAHYKHSYYSDMVYLYHKSVSNVSDVMIYGIDYAELELLPESQNMNQNHSPFPPPVRGFYNATNERCNESKDIKLGDKLYALGYPSVGSDSLTITEGIVSGFLGDLSQWIKVSANINPGNSGGVAISEDGCFYGIPTQLMSDYSGSIGQILGSGFISDFVEGAIEDIDLDKKLLVKDVEFVPYENELYQFRLMVPASWALLEDYSGVSFKSAEEHVLDRTEAVSITMISLDGQMSFDIFAQARKEQFELEGFEVLSAAHSTFKGHPSYQITIGEHNGLQIIQTSILYGEFVYSLNEIVDADRPERYSLVLEKIKDSFEIISE